MSGEGAGELVLVVTFRARPGGAGPLEARLREMAMLSSAEDGCHEYTLLHDLEDPERFVFYEVWEDQAAHARHDQTEHLLAFQADLPDLVAEPPELIRLRRD